MSLVECFDPGPRGLWWILTVIGQVTVVILAAAVVTGAVLRRRAAACHRVWLSALACTLLGPAVVLLTERIGITLPVIPWPLAAAERPAEPPRAIVVAEPVSPSSTPSPRLVASTGAVEAILPPVGVVDGTDREPSKPEQADRRVAFVPDDPMDELRDHQTTTDPAPAAATDGRAGRALVGALTIAWAAGALFGLARIAAGWWGIRKLRRSLRPFEPGEHADSLDEVRDALDGRDLPPIATSTAVDGPVAIGLLKSIVILPEGLADGLSREELRDVLVHECAHVLRRDTLVGVLQRIAAALYWPHPLVHHMNARLARAREEVCDNFVLRRGDPCGYARMLLKLTQGRESGAVACPGVGLMDAHWTLQDRIAGLLDPRRDAMTRPNRRAPGVAALILVVTSLGIAGLRPAGPIAARAEAEAPAPGGAIAAAPQSPERTVRGVVVDEQGKPVAGATVSPVRREKARGPATTGADGRFTLAIGGFMLMEEDLIASAESGALLGLGKYVEPQNSGPADPVRIVLKPSRIVTVHVNDKDKKPIPEAAVEAIGFDFDQDAKTGADGKATLRIPADAQVRWVIGLKPGVGFDYFENYETQPAIEVGPLPANVTLTLDGARTVRIKAVDSSGRPVPNVELLPWYIGRTGKLDEANVGGAMVVAARTDDQGIATFDWLPTDADPAVPFLPYPSAYTCPESPVYRSGSGPVELRAHLLRNTPIRGVVRQADGRPAAGILVRAEGRGATNHYCRLHTRTAQDGSYALDVYPEQSYIIAAIDDQKAARSLTGILVREGQPLIGLDLTLGEGTLLHGRVTRQPEGTPAAGETVTLSQSGKALPRELISPRGEGEAESLPRWAKTDADGRYRFRIGPGDYELWGPDHSGKEELKIAAEGEVKRDFQLTGAMRRGMLVGVAIEKAASGERPIDGAIVEASGVGRDHSSSRTIADREGRFRLPVNLGRDLVLYAHDRAGTMAGLTVVKADAADVRALAAPASRIHGRVVDGQARPQAGRTVHLQFDSVSDFSQAGHFSARALTDANGQYEFRGVVVGTIAEVSVLDDESPFGGGGVQVERVEVRGPDPIAIRDLVAPKAGDRVAPARVEAASRPAAVAETVASRPSAPTWAEMEALVQAIGRDPVTPELVDRAWLLTRPQFAWFAEASRIRSLLADQDFTGRVDQAARSVLGRPADTLTLIGQAVSYHVGYNVETMKAVLSREARPAANTDAVVRGKVVEVDTGRPIAGAIVYASDALARTDNDGAFTLSSRRPQRRGMIWVEADGFAMAEYPAFEAARGEGDVRIELVKEAPLVGRVVGSVNRPIPGATVRAWVKHFEFRRPRPEPAPQNDSFGIPIEVRTDADGRFAFRGLPPGLAMAWYEVRHPEHRTYQSSQSLLKSGESSTIRLEPGCKVAGIVVDESGQPIRGAMVEIRGPGRLQDEFSAQTAEDGRFRFGGVSPGRWMVVIQPERQAPVYGPVVATQDRPVENQYVVGPGAYISGKVVGTDGKPVAHAAVGWVKPVDERGNGVEGLELGRMTQTAEDGTFRLGPLAQGEYDLTALIEEPRRLGRTKARSNESSAVIRLEPDNPRESLGRK